VATIQVDLPTPHPKQQQVIDESARFNVVVCGRRFGKKYARAEPFDHAGPRGEAGGLVLADIPDDERDLERT
jgi:hypothetical protein